MTKPRLIVIDDDALLGSVLAGNLRQAGFEVTCFTDPLAALAEIPAQDAADLLILDWKMPGLSGLELLVALRGRDIAVPALFFTSHNDTLYEEAALAQGAADFIDKTRSFTILLQRITLILERTRSAEPADTHWVSGRLRLAADHHAIFWDERPVALTFGEFRVVELLAGSARDVSYREIYDALRGENFIAGDGADGYRANVRALIKRIREKFLEIDPEFAAIVNYPGFGYRWSHDG